MVMTIPATKGNKVEDSTSKEKHNTVQPADSKWIPLETVAEELNVVRGTVYHYIRQLKLTAKKFPLDRHTYLSKRDYEKIVAARTAAATKKH